MDGCGRGSRAAAHLDCEGRFREEGAHRGDAAWAAAGRQGDA